MTKKKPTKGRMQQHKPAAKPWEPDAKQMEWYRQWTEDLMSYQEIGDNSKPRVTRSAIMQSVHKTGDWLQLQCYDKIMRFRVRQTAALEKMASEARRAWVKSIRMHSVKTVKDGNSAGEHGGAYDETAIKTEEHLGNPAYLAEARAAMADVRKIWGVEAAVKSAVEIMNPNEIEGLPQMNGFNSHAEALAAVSKALAARAEIEAARTAALQ